MFVRFQLIIFLCEPLGKYLLKIKKINQYKNSNNCIFSVFCYECKLSQYLLLYWCSFFSQETIITTILQKKLYYNKY